MYRGNLRLHTRDVIVKVSSIVMRLMCFYPTAGMRVMPKRKLVRKVPDLLIAVEVESELL